MDKHKSDVVDGLVETFGESVRDLLAQAYAEGFAKGHSHAKMEIKTKMAGFFDEPNSTRPPDVATQSSQKTSSSGDDRIGNRAAHGTVRPAIAHIIKSAARGLSTESVFKALQDQGRKDIKRNSVRGALNAMKVMGKTRKTGKLWFLVETESNSGGIVPPDGQEDMLKMPNGPH